MPNLALLAHESGHHIPAEQHDEHGQRRRKWDRVVVLGPQPQIGADDRCHDQRHSEPIDQWTAIGNREHEEKTDGAHDQRLDRIGVRGNGLEVAIEHSGDEVGMDFHTRKIGGQRRGTQILQSLRRRSYKSDGAREIDRGGPRQHVGGAAILEYFLRTAKRYQCGAIFGDGNNQTAYVERFQRVVGTEARRYCLGFQNFAGDGERQRGVVSAAVELDHGHAAHDVVGIERRVDVPASGGGLRQRREIRRISDLGKNLDPAMAEILGPKHGWRQCAFFLRLLRETESEHHRFAAQCIRELCVEIEFRAPPGERFRVAPVVLQI